MQVEKISKNRNMLFGIGALGVLLVHSNQYVKWPSVIGKLFSFGGIGVYIFAFLSGMGLFVSMSHNYAGGGKIRQFYKKRFLRVGVTYLIIAGVWYAIKYLLLQFSLVEFLYELSTLSYWLEHKGAWYVAMLIPLYFVYPFYYKWLNVGNIAGRTIMTMCALLTVSLGLFVMNEPLYSHLVQVLNSLLIFAGGSYVGFLLCGEGHNGKLSYGWLLITLLFYPTRAMISGVNQIRYLGNLSSAMLGVAVCMSVSIIGKYVPSIIRRVLEWLGSISLELYLTNIFLIQAVAIMLESGKLSGIKNWVQWAVIYFGICLIGIGISVFVKYASLHIFRKQK